MKNSKQLKEERAAIAEKIETLSKVEARTELQTTEMRDAIKEEERLSNEIEATLELEKRAADKAASEARASKNAGAGAEASKSEEKELRKFSISKLIVAAEGREAVDAGFEMEVLDQFEGERASTIGEGKKLKANQRSFYLPEKVLDAIYPEKRATMITSSSTLGGNFIPTEKLGFFEALFAATVLEMLGVQKLTGLSANTDLTGFTASVTSAWAATEVGTQTPSNPTTAARQLRPNLLYTACDISRRLLLQTNPSIDTFVLNNMMRSMAVAFEAAVINGAGSAGVPLGILGSGIGSVAIGTDGGAPTYAKILSLIQTVKTADGSNANRMFLTNNKVVAKLKQTAIDSGSGAMVMGYNGLFNSQIGVIDGYNVAVTSNVPSTLDKGATTGVCSALIFGDFSQVVTGQFGGVELIVDPYTNARTGTLSYTVNQFLDSTVLQPTALAAIADLTTT